MRVFVGVGSNIEPEKNIRRALLLMRRDAKVRAVSTFYRTRPEGNLDQPDFYNGVIEIETELSPPDLLKRLRKIESNLGRVRTKEKSAPRTIDLDILLYGDMIVSSPELAIPHPYIRRRAFLIIPLTEIAPDLILPGTGRTISKLAKEFEGHDMVAMDEFTDSLRREISDGL